MIGALRGRIARVEEEWAIVDVGGVGYQVYAAPRVLASLEPGREARFAVETLVREDMIRLYGFLEETERVCFTRLQAVQGVGAKAALAILQVLRPAELLDAVALGDAAAIARAQGVGKKIAARIVSELQGAAPALLAAAEAGGAFTPPGSDADAETRTEGLKDMQLRNDAISALINLGYDRPQAMRAVAAAYAKCAADPEEAELIRLSLKEIDAV